MARKIQTGPVGIHWTGCLLFWSLREDTFKSQAYHILLNNTVCMIHSFIHFFLGPSFCPRATVVSKTEEIPIFMMFYIYGICGGLREDLKRFSFLAHLLTKLKQKRKDWHWKSLSKDRLPLLLLGAELKAMGWYTSHVDFLTLMSRAGQLSHPVTVRAGLE